MPQAPIPPPGEPIRNDIDGAFAVLGYGVRDKITGFAGVATSISFDLYGCIQVVIQPATDEKGQISDGRWFDLKRLEIHGPLMMPQPTFARVGGPASLPAKPEGPNR